ncbi:MAG: alkaline phosphatase D family protein [Vicinamibacterales bacterium]
MRVDRRSALRSLVAAWSASRLRVGAQALPEPAWLLTGAVTDHSAVVKAAFVDRPASVPPLLVSRQRDLTAATAVPARVIDAPSTSYAGRTIAEYRLDGLDPAAEYFGGMRPGTGTLARFRTFGRGPCSFVAAFASCAGGTRVVPMSHVSNSGVFAALAALDPDVFVHMGDLHYYNIPGPARPITAVAGLFRRALDRVLSQERQALFYRRTPLVYVWDDHDYGTDNSDGRAPTRDAARFYYASDIPAFPTPLSPRADGPIAQVFDIGRVRFLVTDTRSERNPATRTMLGAPQLAWLLAELDRAAAEQVPLVVWVNTVPWITRDGDSEGWGQFADERRRIGEHITTLGLGPRLVVLSGDAHMLAFDDGRNNPHGGFVVAQAAPLDRFLNTKGGPYSHQPADQRNGQFGVLRVTDDGTTLTAELQGHRYDGSRRAAPVPGVSLTIRCSGGTCRLVT